VFADRLLLVEGVTEAALLREFGWVWAGEDLDKQAFVDALSIVPMGTKVGSWAPRLLATKDHELCSRLAVLRDSDLGFEGTPTDPGWASEFNADVVLVAQSHPTLEPQVTSGNEALVAAALGDIEVAAPASVTPETIHELFRSRRKKEDGTTQPAGVAARHKGAFAMALAARIREARLQGSATVVVAPPMKQIFEFLYEVVSPLVPGGASDVANDVTPPEVPDTVGATPAEPTPNVPPPAPSQ
jgi:putative ATP-dependent endonuclease of OLD family